MIAKSLKTKDLSFKWCIITALALVVFKLLLTSQQMVYLTPYDAPIDDMLMFNATESMMFGNWLGDYGWLTLSKHYFFSVWLYFLWALKIPYLIGGAMLWTVACTVCAFAFKPVLKKRVFVLILFALLLFNPAQAAAEVQLRVYRDNIFPAFCLLCIAGMCGAALRIGSKLKNYIGYIIAATIGFALAYVTREDGTWLLPFLIGASVAIIIFILRAKGLKGKLVKIFALLMPYLGTVAVVIVFCIINFNVYGRFVFSDFTSKEFNAAMGAMTRVSQENFKPKIIVPKDARDKIYDKVPMLQPLQAELERGWYYGRYGNLEQEEFNTGGFHWALREAAGKVGIYDSAQGAKEFWQKAADEINALCDSGELPSDYKRRNTTTTPIRAEFVAPTLLETAANLGRVLTFSEGEAYFDKLSYVTKEEYSGFMRILRTKPNVDAIAGTDQSYYSLLQRATRLFFDITRCIYAVVISVAFVLAICWQAKAVWGFIRKKNQENPLFFIIMLGLLLSIIFRLAMIAFMFVSSFNKGIVHIMYLSSVHPIAILYSVLGAGMFMRSILKNKKFRNLNDISTFQDDKV